ncbi:MAG: hypothetical protein ORN49_05500, partial [Rhodobacteraceae bacterium]|nr:hypothetical protein [Paracoccaceae bacterium]
VRAVEFCAEVGHMRGAEVPTVVILNRMSAVRDGVQRDLEREIGQLDAAGRLVLCPVRLAERGAFRAIVEEGCTLAGLADVRPVTGLDAAAQNAAALLRALAQSYGEITAKTGKEGQAA